ncbi:MAG TPA: CoA-binding protein [Leptospiraceae bacterium]|nr:CoA-binding protein [Leptospiraceae bacterium]
MGAIVMGNQILELLKKKDVTVAVIGATNDRTKYGNIIYRDLKNKGIRVFGVNPKATTIEGDPAYKRVQDIPERPDILDFVIPPKIGLETVKELIKDGYDHFWLQPGAESDDILELLNKENKSVLAHSCVMVETR